MKKNIIVTIIGVSLLLWMAGPGDVSAYTYDVFCGKLKISGHLQNTTAWRTQDSDIFWPDRPGERTRDAGDLAMLRNQFQLEVEYTFGDHISIFGIYRFAYEGSYDMQSVDQRARSRDYIDDELRELYVTLAFDEWTFKIGKQQLIWGETDALRMADVMNPLDFGWHWSGPEGWEDLRRGIRMIVINYAPERFVYNNVSLEWVFIPEDFKPHGFPEAGSNWEPTFGLPWGLFKFAARTSEPKSNNDEYGFRVRGVIKDVEASFFNFYGRKDGPLVDLPHFVGGFILPSLGIPATHGPGYCDYPKYNSTGLTLNYYDPVVTKTVFRFEGSYNFDEPTNALSFALIKRDTVNFMIGFDRPTWVRWLNDEQTFFLSFQWFFKRWLDWSDSVGMVEFGGSNDEYQNILTFLAQTNYNNNTWTPQILMAYDLSGCWWLQPQVKWTYSTNWSFFLGANFFEAPTNRDSFWGYVRDNDEIYIKIRYGFR